MAVLMAVGIVVVLGALLAALIVVPLKLINKAVMKNQVDSQIALWKAQEELNKKKTLTWICDNCGASNHNRMVCEYCGAGKPNEPRV